MRNNGLYFCIKGILMYLYWVVVQKVLKLSKVGTLRWAIDLVEILKMIF